MRAFAVGLLLVATVGCHKSSPTGDAATGGDAAQSVDLAPTPDLATSPAVVGIPCGSATCTAMAQFCCTYDSGATGTCGMGNDAASCDTAGLAELLYCDGPEDCPSDSPYCCYNSNSSHVAVCGAMKCGGTEFTGYELCHGAADCDGLTCCSSTSTRYELCLASCP